MPNDGAEKQRKLVFIGIGGASCSGKTTLAQHLLKILPSDTILVHQDDFAPPDSQIPIHPVHGIADWDDPNSAIDWNRFRDFLLDLGEKRSIPPGHKTYDYLLKPVPVEVNADIIAKQRERFSDSPALQDTQFIIVDGFLMFWDPIVTSFFSATFFVREPQAVLRQRRDDRKGYVTAEDFWVDPPGYFDQIVWPAYLKAHGSLFEGGDVENGSLSHKAASEGINLLDAQQLGMSGMVEQLSTKLIESLGP